MKRIFFLLPLIFFLESCFPAKNEKAEYSLNETVLKPSYVGRDATRKKMPIVLRLVADGFNQPTDLQFVPEKRDLLFVLEKEGQIQWVDLGKKRRGRLLKISVLTFSEQGLLGLAFHPRFLKNGKFYLNSTPLRGGRTVSEISEWEINPLSPIEQWKPVKKKVILQVEQPYANHNAGQLAFGPDGYLYIGFGDGGWRGDPHEHGQNPMTFLGSMLRIDIDQTSPGKNYAIPPDNPFVGKEGYLPEIWAMGLRNPWRYSFDPVGRLVVADVGQDLWEEISIVEKGKNYGWNLKEGFHCYQKGPRCKKEGLTDPIYEYGREEGISITGGAVYQGKAIPSLRGKYIFGDYGSGRIWALAYQNIKSPTIVALGKWEMQISTFGRDEAGEIYVADFATGKIYRIERERGGS